MADVELLWEELYRTKPRVEFLAKRMGAAHDRRDAILERIGFQSKGKPKRCPER